MKNSLFEEKLSTFKQNEKPETVLLISEDAQLQKIIVAWPNLSLRVRDELNPPEGGTDSEIWDWLWQNTIYDQKELILKSGSSSYEFDKKMATLIGNRILYPDGTVNSFVQRFLRERVFKLFDSKTKKPQPRK